MWSLAWRLAIFTQKLEWISKNLGGNPSWAIAHSGLPPQFLDIHSRFFLNILPTASLNSTYCSNILYQLCAYWVRINNAGNGRVGQMGNIGQCSLFCPFYLVYNDVDSIWLLACSSPVVIQFPGERRLLRIYMLLCWCWLLLFCCFFSLGNQG